MNFKPKTILQWLSKYRVNALLIIVLSTLLLGSSRLGIWRNLEWFASDQLFQLRDEPEIDDRIVIVTVDEEDIQYVEKWPMPDRDLATILSNIDAQQPRAIALDFYRDLVVEPGHEQLLEFFENSSTIIGVTKVSGEAIAPPPALAEKGQIAANDVVVDGDGKIRLGTVLLSNVDGSLITSLPINLALTYLGAENIQLEEESEAENIYRLGGARFVPLSERDGHYQANDLGGYLIPLNYRGGLEKFPHISMTEVLEDDIPDGLFSDKLVMFGPTAPSLNDIHQTPYSNRLFANTEYMAGIVLHANLTSQILSSALDGRPMLRLTAKPIIYGIIFGCILISHGLGVIYIRSWGWSSLGILCFSFGFAGIAYGAFLSGWLLPIATPLIAIGSTWYITIIATLWLNLKEAFSHLKTQHQELEQTYNQLSAITDAYSRFVPFDYLEFLRKNKIVG